MRRLLEWMERPLRAPAASGRAADVIVVLGAPCRNGVPGRFALERARAAAALWARGVAPVVLVTQRFHSRRSLREFQRTGWWDEVEVVYAESEVAPAEIERRPGRAAYFMVREYLAWVRRWR